MCAIWLIDLLQWLSSPSQHPYDESTQVGYWIFDVFAQASGPLKAFAFLTMVKSDKTEMFGEKELDNLVGLLRLNFVKYISTCHGSV